MDFFRIVSALSFPKRIFLNSVSKFTRFDQTLFGIAVVLTALCYLVCYLMPARYNAELRACLRIPTNAFIVFGLCFFVAYPTIRKFIDLFKGGSDAGLPWRTQSVLLPLISALTTVMIVINASFELDGAAIIATRQFRELKEAGGRSVQCLISGLHISLAAFYCTIIVGLLRANHVLGDYLEQDSFLGTLSNGDTPPKNPFAWPLFQESFLRLLVALAINAALGLATFSSINLSELISPHLSRSVSPTPEQVEQAPRRVLMVFVWLGFGTMFVHGLFVLWSRSVCRGLFQKTESEHGKWADRFARQVAHQQSIALVVGALLAAVAFLIRELASQLPDVSMPGVRVGLVASMAMFCLATYRLLWMVSNPFPEPPPGASNL